MSSPEIILKKPKAVGAIAILTLFVLAAVPFSRDASDPAIPKRVPASFPATWRFPAGAHATLAPHAMVASDNRIASEVGAQIMRDGGNAVDAAVATGFALAVAYPEAGNLGGGGYMVIRMADGRVAALDYRETAPLAASRDMYVGTDGKLTGESVIGPKASGGPGSVAGMLEAHRRVGGLITKEDLARYQPIWRTPIRSNFRGYTFIAMPPSSSGGTTVTETLNILEAYGKPAPFGSTAEIHALASASQRAFVDRNSKLGDPDFVKVPLATLTSKRYAKS